jgi:hypothetical protein
MAAGENPLIAQGLISTQEVFRMSSIQRGELKNIVNAQIATIVVLSRHLKWIKPSLGRTLETHFSAATQLTLRTLKD